MRWAGRERPSRSGLGSLPGAPGLYMPSDPPLPVSAVRNGQANGIHTPHWPDHSHDCPEWIRRTGSIFLTDRTTVKPDLKGCLEEVSKIAALAGTRLQRHDPRRKLKGPRTRNRVPDEPRPQDISGATLQKKGRHEKSTLGGSLAKILCKGARI
jgi:hypothetical protein